MTPDRADWHSYPFNMAGHCPLVQTYFGKLYFSLCIIPTVLNRLAIYQFLFGMPTSKTQWLEKVVSKGSRAGAILCASGCGFLYDSVSNEM